MPRAGCGCGLRQWRCLTGGDFRPSLPQPSGGLYRARRRAARYVRPVLLTTPSWRGTVLVLIGRVSVVALDADRIGAVRKYACDAFEDLDGQCQASSSALPLRKRMSALISTSTQDGARLMRIISWSVRSCIAVSRSSLIFCRDGPAALRSRIALSVPLPASRLPA